jgi:CheY-like chemotaxis protein
MPEHAVVHGLAPSPPRLLIVEDELTVAWGLSQTARELRWKVCAIVTTQEAAVEAASQLKPDAILMDYRLAMAETTSLPRVEFELLSHHLLHRLWAVGENRDPVGNASTARRDARATVLSARGSLMGNRHREAGTVAGRPSPGSQQTAVLTGAAHRHRFGSLLGFF